MEGKKKGRKEKGGSKLEERQRGQRKERGYRRKKLKKKEIGEGGKEGKILFFSPSVFHVFKALGTFLKLRVLNHCIAHCIDFYQVATVCQALY